MAKRTPLLPPEPARVVALSEVEEIPDDETGTPGNIPSPPDEDDAKVNEFLRLFGEKDYRVRVEVYSDRDRRWAFLDAYSVDGFDPYETCKKFGPGRYRLGFTDQNNRYVKVGNRPEILIGGAIGTVSPVVPPAPPPPANPLDNPLIALILSQAEASRKETNELMRALLTRPEPAKSSSSEVIELFKSMRSLAPEDPMKKVQETLMLRMIEKGLDDSGGGGGEGLLSEIKDAMPIIKEMLSARAPALRQAVAQPRPMIAANPQEPVTVSPLLSALKPYVAIFRAKAEKSIDQDRVAQFLIDEVYDSLVPLIKEHVLLAKAASDEAIVESLVNRAKDPSQLDELFKAAPELAPHRDYLASVIAKAVAILEAPEPEEPSHADTANA